jgi:hypothetical protein
VLGGPRAEVEDESARGGGGRTAALLGTVGLAVVMAALPAAVAMGAVPEAVAGLAGLVAVWGGVKVAATVWGLAAAFD